MSQPDTVLGYGFLQTRPDKSIHFKSLLTVEREISLASEIYPFMEPTKTSLKPLPNFIQQEFSQVFSKSKATSLPEHRPFNCEIN